MRYSSRALLVFTLIAVSGCPRPVSELGSITITPDTGRVARGETVQYVATALYSDGSIRDITAEASWSVDDAFVATMSETPGLAQGLQPGETVVRLRYQDRMLTRPLVVGRARLRELQLDPPRLTLPVGLGARLTVTALDSDGAKYDVTPEAVWTSAAPSVASVTDGLVTGRAPGRVSVSASVQGLIVSASVDVTAATIEQLDVQPAMLTLQRGVTRQLSATALLSDGSSLDVTAQAAWRSSAPAIVLASELPGEEGLIAARAVGAARITASLLGRAGSVDVTVTAATLSSLELTPALTSLAAGTTQRFVATGVFSDQTTADLSTQVTWASSNDTVLTVTQGLARGLSAGRVTVSAAFGAVRASRDLLVSPAALVSLELDPASPSVARGLTTDVHAVGVFSDGTRQDLTAQAVWRVADASLAQVSNAVSTSGRVSGLLEGTTELSATVGAIVGRTPLNVSAASLLSLQLSPTQPTLPLGTRLPFTATGLFSDGTSQDLTAQATWTSSAPACVSISSQGASRGEALAVTRGSATLTATVGGRAGSTTVTVTDAALVSLELSPGQATLPLGVVTRFTATGIFTDGTVADLTAQALWSTSATSIATVSNAPGHQGEVSALAVGASQLSARVGAISGHAELTVSPATLTRLELAPATATLPVGLTRDFVLTGTYSDGSSVDLTTQATFTSLAPGIATVSNAAGSQGQVTGRAAGNTRVVASAMGLDAQASVTVTPATLMSLTLSPPSFSLANGTTRRLRADATWSDGVTADVTTQVSWTSTAPAIAAVSNASGSEGTVSALAVGAATVRAQLGTMSASSSVTVSPATLDTIEVTPTNPSVPLGATHPLTATGRYSDGSAQDLSSQATWASSAPAIASVSNTAPNAGRVQALSQGTATLSATFGGKTGRTTVTVSPATLARVELTPAQPRLAKDTRISLTATGVWSDGASQPLTESCQWASAAPAIATVSTTAGSRGRVTGLAGGTATVSATCAGVTGTVDVLVTTATLTTIQLTPPSPTAAAGFTLALTATGVFSDATTQPFTDFVSWSSSDTTKATVSNSASSEGVVLARAQGTSTISATALGVTGSVSFVVSAAVLQSVELSPAPASTPKGLTQAFVATGHFSDGSSAPVTEAATWSTSAPAIATVSNAAGSRGLATALLEGSATISATVGGLTASTTFTVSPAALTGLTVTPSAPTLARGLGLQLTATGSFTDGTTRDLTAAVTWSTGDGAVASISNADGSRGALQTLAVGTTTLLATAGSISGTTTLTVTPAQLVAIGVTPANASVPRGLSQQLTAMGVYTDGSTVDLTAQATWASSVGARVSVSNASGSHGLAQALSLGASSLSATFNGVTGATTVTVTAAVLQQLSLTPALPSVAAGLGTPLSVTGIYSDASTQDLTATASWSTADATIATAAAGGLVTGHRVGSTTVSATVGSVTGSTSLTVTAALLAQLQVTPQNVSRPKGLPQQFTATGVFTDATTQDLTTSVTWASSDATKVVLSNANGTRGRATTPGVGAVTVSATLGSITGSTPFTVTPALVTSVFLMPGGSTAPLGSVRQYTAYALYTDASTQNVTAQAAWSSSNPAVATVSNASGSYGLATTLATGNTTISASWSGFNGTSALNVIQTNLTRIDLTPAGGSTALGYTRQFIAIGTYDDGTTQVLSDVATWSSSDPNVAFISTASGSRGLLSTVGVGTATISATWAGITGSTSHTVTPAVLVSLGLSPSSLTLSSSGTAQLTAIGFFSDGTTQDLTTAVSWTSANPAVVQVSNASGSEGLASGISAGNTSISATQGSVSASLNVLVN